MSTPGASREGSLHGGGMWAWGAGRENPAPSCPSTPAASREASLHGGNAFGGEAAKPRKAGETTMWDWQKGRPSPESSAHAGTSFAALFGKGGEGSGHGGNAWNWGQDRTSAPNSRNNSTHGGNAFAAASPEAQLKSTMRRNDLSIGSAMWQWGGEKGKSPGASGHGQNNFAPSRPTGTAGSAGAAGR